MNSFCYVCGIDNNVDVFICDSCDHNVVHLNCANPLFQRTPRELDRFYCLFCLNLENGENAVLGQDRIEWNQTVS